MKRIFTLSLLICLPLLMDAQSWPTYAGKQSCYTCHSSYQAEFEKSGHPWKIQRIDRSKVDGSGFFKPFPVGTNEAGIALPPEAATAGLSYLGTDTTVAFMIGGFGWKARWMSKDGYIYKGTKAQYNIGTIHSTLKGYSSYDATQVNNAPIALAASPAKYTCGGCHTTGWLPYNATTQPVRKDNLPGMEGTFFEYGVQCEGCHGPSKNHADNPGVKPPKDGFDGCKACHARGNGLKIPLKSDKQFLDHREQYDQMLFSKHRRTANMKCTTCHDPHKSTVFDRGGLKTAGKTCQPCHSNKSDITITMIRGGVETKAVHTCNECHMPYIGNTALKQNNNRGDQASHMWKINTKAETKFTGMFDTSAAAMIVKIPTDSVVAHTLDFACLGCHTTRNVAWASGYAVGIHSKTIIVGVAEEKSVVPSAFYLNQNYPNPFNPSTMIAFGLPERSTVRLAIYNEIGQHICIIADGEYGAGKHTVTWNGTDESGKSVSAGVYFARMETDKFIKTNKMLLTK